MVLFVVSTWGEGRGGHFNTLATYIKAYKSPYHILVVGKNIPPVLKEFEVNITQTSLSLIPKIELNQKFEIIHCFDQWAYLIGFIYASKCEKVKLILTKSGGINTIWFPRARNMWLISKENYDYYSSFKSVEKIKFYDNRVVDFDLIDVSHLKEKFQNSCIILRIGRISEYYRKSFSKMMDYSKKYEKCKFVVIGTVESDLLYNELIASNIEVLNQPEYTKNARKYLGLADLFIGQGRSAMEAIFKEIPTFVFNNKHNALDLVESQNIETVKFQNFSERATFDSSCNLEEYITSKDHKMITNLRPYVEYNPTQLTNFYEVLHSKKIKFSAFPLLLYLRYVVRILKRKR
ncbi:hypothetical protein [Winogradskyella sp.]|uniref:hypothetical protein n=1 Tax=Winogradskyella sp. TaxID=1883156 RepID=UPI003AB1774E